MELISLPQTLRHSNNSHYQRKTELEQIQLYSAMSPGINGEQQSYGCSEEAAAESKRELSSGSAQQQRAMAVDSDAQDTCIKTEGTKEQAHDNIAATSGDISSLPLSAQQQHQQNQQEQGREMAQGSAWRNVKHAMITFITSLIPAPPPEIDQAEVDAIEGERVL
ncbi:hypothetical protein EDD11_002162 [Mortierella claussenii]|nr:hypothetical protein EDD11_002162 [Mortierella claussenii]